MRSLLTNAAIFLALGLCLADPSLSKEGKNNQSSSADGVESSQPDKISTDHLISTSNNDTNENKFGKGNKQENDFSVDSSAVDYEIGEDTSRSSMTAIEMGSVKPDESESSSDSTILDSVATSNDSQVDSSSKTDSNEDDSDNVTSQAKSTTLSSPSPLATESEALEMLLNFLKESVGKMLKSALPTIVQTGMEANVSAQCANSFMVLTDGLQQGKDWAFRMLDSSGKPPSGILEGTLTDFGSFEQCIDLKVPSNDVKSSGERDYLEGRYCVMDIKAALDENIDVARRPSNIPEDSVVWGRALREFWSRNSLLSFRYGLCIPSACHKEEITEIANYRSWKHFLLSFSLKRNTKKLLDSAKKPYSSPLRHLDGIRFFSVTWIIMGHTYFYTDFVHYHHYRRLKHIQEIDDDFIFMPIANFTLSVNTFFFISGLLVVYANWKKLTVSEGKISITDFFIHKVWRIWPPYLATIGLVLIMPLIGSGPLWPQAVENTAKLCRQNWWTNILFLNNFLPPDQLCLLHTWFLAAHMQFHLFSAIILYILYRFPKLTITILSFFTILAGAGVYIYTVINNLRWPTVIADAVFTDYSQQILTLYIMPYNHLGSYLVGIVGGYYLVKYKNSMISTRTQAIAWIASLSVMSLIIFAPHAAFAGTMPGLTEAAVYLSVHRTAWAIAIGWLVFACSTERGGFINSLLSWPAFGPLSNLSYLAYLVHPLLMLFHTGRTRERVYFGHYELFNTFLARTVMAFVLAYILYVTVELPFAALEKYIFHKKPKARPETAEYRANGPVFAIVGKNIPHLTSSKKVTSDSV